MKETLMVGRFRMIHEGDHIELELEDDDGPTVVLIHPTRDGTWLGDIWWVIERRDPLRLAETA